MVAHNLSPRDCLEVDKSYNEYFVIMLIQGGDGCNICAYSTRKEVY